MPETAKLQEISDMMAESDLTSFVLIAIKMFHGRVVQFEDFRMVCLKQRNMKTVGQENMEESYRWIPFDWC